MGAAHWPMVSPVRFYNSLTAYFVANMAFSPNMEASVKLILERQEKAFAHLTYLAVWIQNHVPVCEKEKELASASRDEVRREVAAFWRANITTSVSLRA